MLGQVNSQYMATMEGPTASGASGGTLYNDAFNVASLNYSITQAQAAGQSPNDLIDQRNAALDNLSQLGNVQVQNNTDGSVTVYFGGVTGTALVNDPVGIPPGGPVPPGDNFGSYSPGGATPGTGWAAAWQSQFSSAATAGTSAASLANTVGGQLGSLIGLAGYSGSGFGNLGAPTCSPPANTTGYSTPRRRRHAGRHDRDDQRSARPGRLRPRQRGQQPERHGRHRHGDAQRPVLHPLNRCDDHRRHAVCLLEPAAGGGATSITPQAVSSSTAAGGNTQGTNNIQVSSLAVSPPATIASNASDNDVALDEAANSGGVADTAYQAFVQQVGSLAQGANTQSATQAALKTQITNQRSSVEGVDLSQEMANLITQQQSYQASAKVMNAFSTVMDSLMSVVGQ